MSEAFYLKLEQQIVDETIKTGLLKGVAYSGKPIKNHGWFKNLIIDLSTLSVAKEKTAVLLDHIPSQVAGNGKVTIGENVAVDGKLFGRSRYAKEIRELAEDGHEWEMSLGVFDGTYREFENETINGIEMASGVVLENGVVREVTVCTLGADMNTSVQLFSLLTKKETNLMEKLNQHSAWAKFACGCGGTKDSTPEELQSKFEADQEKIAEKQAEIDVLKAKIEELQREIDEEKAKDEEEVRETELKAAAQAKNIKLSDDSIKKAAKSKEATAVLKLAIDGMEKQNPSADPAFKGKVTVTNPADPASQGVDLESGPALFAAANKLVKEGKFKNFEDALESLTKGGQ